MGLLCTVAFYGKRKVCKADASGFANFLILGLVPWRFMEKEKFAKRMLPALQTF